MVSEEGYAKIRELIPGGPADLSARIKVGDRISAVAQGNGDFVETLDMKLDKIVGRCERAGTRNKSRAIIPDKT